MCPVQSRRQWLVLIAAWAALLSCAPTHAALPGVTEFAAPAEKITDAMLSPLLYERVNAARVIAIGETVHGSPGLLRIQTRLIQYLVTHHGIRLLVWETAAERSLELARWLAACSASRAPPPLDVLYFPTAADRPLFEWLCEHNRVHPHDPVVFRGMDVWDRPWEHYARIRAAAGAWGTSAQIKAIANTCPGYRAASWADIEAVLLQGLAGYEPCQKALSALLDHARRVGLDKKNPPEADAAFEVAISASTLLGWLGYHLHERNSDVLSWNERDRAQGRNLMLLMEKHGAARAVVAAHTSHVSHGRSAADWWGYGDLKSGVHYFHAFTAKPVFNLALTAYSASGVQGEWSLPVSARSMDKKLHDAGHRLAYFASSAQFLSGHPRWWMQNQNTPGPHENGVEIVPRDHFDGYFFVDQSHLDQALPQRPVWRP